MVEGKGLTWKSSNSSLFVAACSGMSRPSTLVEERLYETHLLSVHWMRSST